MKQKIDLNKIWSETNGMYVAGGFIFLRVQTKDMPGSYLTDDQWFVGVSRLKEGGWSLMVRPDGLHDVIGPDAEIAETILRKANLLPPSRETPAKWTPVNLKSPNITVAPRSEP